MRTRSFGTRREMSGTRGLSNEAEFSAFTIEVVVKRALATWCSAILAIVTAAAVPATCGADSAEMPLVIPRIAPPAVDGKVELAEWGKAAAVQSFVENSGKAELRAQTRARIGY